MNASRQCASCPRGYASTYGQAACNECEQGQYADKPDAEATSCELCGKGQYGKPGLDPNLRVSEAAACESSGRYSPLQVTERFWMQPVQPRALRALAQNQSPRASAAQAGGSKGTRKHNLQQTQSRLHRRRRVLLCHHRPRMDRCQLRQTASATLRAVTPEHSTTESTRALPPRGGRAIAGKACDVCNKGTFSEQAGYSCTECPAGWFQDQNLEPSLACKVCPSGYGAVKGADASPRWIRSLPTSTTLLAVRAANST